MLHFIKQLFETDDGPKPLVNVPDKLTLAILFDVLFHLKSLDDRFMKYSGICFYFALEHEISSEVFMPFLRDNGYLSEEETHIATPYAIKPRIDLIEDLIKRMKVTHHG